MNFHSEDIIRLKTPPMNFHSEVFFLLDLSGDFMLYFYWKTVTEVVK